MTDIVFSSDDGFSRQLLVAAASAVYASRTGDDGVRIHVLDCGISDDKWATFEKQITEVAEKCKVFIEIARHNIDMRQFAKVPAWTNGSKAAWARILLPQILSSVYNCIYADCDIFFIENPSEILRELEKSGKVILGHKNPFGDNSPDAKWFKKNGLPFCADEYFCSGLVAMNLDLMRSRDIVEKCWEFLKKYPNPISVDQAVLNYVCYSMQGILSDGWGLFTHECFTDKVPIKAIHFSGGWPWKTAKNTYDALCIKLSGKAVEIWRRFQLDILGEIESSKSNVRFGLRVKALSVLYACRLMLFFNVRPSRLCCLLELVELYSGPSFQLDGIKSRFTCIS